MSKESNCLDGFTQSHLICQDSVNSLIIQVIEPLETLELICFKISLEHVRFFYCYCHGLLHSDFLIIKVILIYLVAVMIIEVVQSSPVLVDHSCDVDPGSPLVNVDSLDRTLIDLHLLFFGS